MSNSLSLSEEGHRVERKNNTEEKERKLHTGIMIEVKEETVQWK